MAMETASSASPPTALSAGSTTSKSSAEVKRYSNPKLPSNAHSRRIKLMCSFGGRIIPRPFDRKLRYVGGDIKLVSISSHAHYEAFLQKLMEIYGGDLAIKYQLPDEDLDSLVSVTSDEDLENMMNECNRLDSLQGASKLRVFVFSMKDIVSLEVNNNAANSAMSELEYVHAVNAIPVEPINTKRNDSDNPFGQVVCNWNASEKLPPHQVSIQASHGATGFYASEADNNEGCASFSHPTPFAIQHTGPLESMSFEAAADKSTYYNRGAVGNNVCGLESGATTCSSTSSHQDPYSLLQFFPGSHKQLHLETSVFVPNLEDSVAKVSVRDHLEQTEQMYGMIVSKNRGSQDAGMNLSGITAPPSEFLSDEFIQLLNAVSSDGDKAVATILPGDGVLLLGTKLQKQLEADCDLSQSVNTESMAPLLSKDDSEQTKLSQEQEHTGIISIQFDKSLNFSNLIPDFICTQAFEALSNNRQLLEACCIQAPSTSAAKQLGESQKAEFTPEETKRDALGKDNMLRFLNSDCSSGLYNGDDRETTNVPISASQPWFKEMYNTVFETCSFEIPLSSLADELPQQVLASDVSFAHQRLLNDYHLQITSQAPGHLPDLSNFPIYGPETHDLSETSSNAFSKAHPLGVVRMQNYDSVKGGEPYSMGFDDTTAQADLLEQVSIENGSRRLPPSVSTDTFQTENAVGSNLFSLNVLKELDDRHEKIPFPYVAAGLMDVSTDDSKDTLISIHQGLQSLNEPSLQQDSPSDAEQKFMQAKEDMEDSLTMLISVSSFSATSPFHVWTKTTQSEHETPPTVLSNFSHEKDIEDMAEKEMKIDEQKLYIEEFQSAVDQSLNLACAAEVEAISRGLQIIHHCNVEKLMELGSGTFGTVYYGKWTGTDVAIKRIKSSCFAGKPSVREGLIADFWRETCILGQLHHPNIVAFYGVVPDGPGGTLAIVTEYMVDGSLRQALQKEDRPLDLHKRLLIAMDVAFGMEYLHGKNVIHFDLKSDNLLVNLRDLQRPICKVGDLGLSKVKQQTMVSGNVRGTLPWMAPELLNESSSLVSEKVDVYSFGIVLWELLTGEQPYANMHWGEIIGGIMNSTLRPPIPRWCDTAYRSLMERCWSADPSKRPTFSVIAKTLRGMEAALRIKSQGQAIS